MRVTGFESLKSQEHVMLFSLQNIMRDLPCGHQSTHFHGTLWMWVNLKLYENKFQSTLPKPQLFSKLLCISTWKWLLHKPLAGWRGLFWIFCFFLNESKISHYILCSFNLAIPHPCFLPCFCGHTFTTTVKTIMYILVREHTCNGWDEQTEPRFWV